MRALMRDLSAYGGALWQAWNRFWFQPADPATLSLIRLLAGGMLLYTHAIWSLDLGGFIGPEGYLPVDRLREMQRLDPAAAGPPWHVWSVFYGIRSTWLLWAVHLAALGVFFLLTVGLFTRTAAVLAYLLAVSYAQRVTPGAFFGLDKTNCMLAMYLMLGPCGARYSLDRLWGLKHEAPAEVTPSVSANIALRLMQLHLCIIYLFSGIAKMGGDNWQAGTAVWWAVANFEYQSLNLTWLAGWPVLVALLTHLTVFWELFYCCLVWNRFARPIVLGIAVAVHGGIALAMGMITFGLAMIIANLSFLQPSTVRKWVDPLAARISLAIVGK